MWFNTIGNLVDCCIRVDSFHWHSSRGDLVILPASIRAGQVYSLGFHERVERCPPFLKVDHLVIHLNYVFSQLTPVKVFGMLLQITIMSGCFKITADAVGLTSPTCFSYRQLASLKAFDMLLHTAIAGGCCKIDTVMGLTS
jgi:hypothetical protein